MDTLQKAARMRRLWISALVLLSALMPCAEAQAPAPDTPALEARIAEMMSHMTREDKLRLLDGENGFYTHAVPDIHLPALKMSDGPMGVRTWGPSNSYAAGISLAAAWDPDLAYRIGREIGTDARSRGVHILLGPGVNIYRAPMGGRNFEYFGEDPYLAAQTAVSYIKGVQSMGVMATVKHFAANNQEYNRHNVSSDIDERTLREIYLPAFEAAVKQAHVASIMDSYNLIDGEHATENRALNIDIAKKEWGFDGFIMSDWGATYNAVRAANGGLDLEMPDGWFMNPTAMSEAIAKGEVSMATVDDKVRRILRKALQFGFLDREQQDVSIPLYRPEARAAALESARESIVLLKNEHNTLPLDADTIRTIAVIGPDAWPALPGGGGSSQIITFAPQAIMPALSSFLGSKVKVLYSRGIPSPDEIFKQTPFTTDGKPGIREETFPNADFTGSSVTTVREHLIGPVGSRAPANWPVKRSVRWSADYTPSETGKHDILFTCAPTDRCRLLVDNKVMLDRPAFETIGPLSVVTMDLIQGQTIHVRLESVTQSEAPVAGLGIRAVDQMVLPDAKQMARIADAVIVCAGFDSTSEFEGMDRPFELPYGQEDLIRTLASLNKRTIVTLTAGGNVAMTGWIDSVPALLHTWYPGQEGGTALAEILFGARNPEGKLPVSFERRWEDNPVHDSYYPNDGPLHVRYKEGLYIGYRYYTSRHVKPLFPFGFGLSYTTFSFSDLKVTPERPVEDEDVTVSVRVSNTGSRAGAEVAQLYLGDPSAHVDRPVKELKGFKKVRLAPGESQDVQFVLDHRSMSYYDIVGKDWKADPGRFVVYVGSSSEDTPLTGSFVLQKKGSAVAAVPLPPPLVDHASPQWKRTFDDPFNGAALSKCWKHTYIGDVHTLEANGEQEWYASPGDGTGYNPFHLHNGVLSISATPTPAAVMHTHPYPYLSGMIMSDGCFAQKYGYFEIRARIPQGKGLWPAFWLLPVSHKWPPEIDVFEMFGAPNSRKEGGLGWVHTGTVGGGDSAFNAWHQTAIDQYSAFHRYGLLWGPENMAIYLDGKLLASQSTPEHFHEPMYLIANLAVGGRWPESPDATTHFPASFEIDEIQAWQYRPWSDLK